MFAITIIIPPTKYANAINGTSFSVTEPILLIPPITTKPTRTNVTIPVIIGLRPNASSADADTEFAWTITLGISSSISINAKNEPSHGILRPFFM